jgi:hypothetical protein
LDSIYIETHTHKSHCTVAACKASLIFVFPVQILNMILHTSRLTCSCNQSTCRVACNRWCRCLHLSEQLLFRISAAVARNQCIYPPADMVAVAPPLAVPAAAVAAAVCALAHLAAVSPTTGALTTVVVWVAVLSQVAVLPARTVIKGCLSPMLAHQSQRMSMVMAEAD